MKMLKAVFAQGKWEIEVDTEEFGKIRLLKPGSSLETVRFNSEAEANMYINTIKHNYTKGDDE